jgi:uncharacterized membrane protein
MPASGHLGISALAGVIVAVTVGVTAGWRVGALIGWVAAAMVFLAWTWRTIWSLDASATSTHAQREDPSNSLTTCCWWPRPS